MLNKRVKSRIFFLSSLLFIAVLIIFLTLKSLEDNIVYFFSPTEIHNKSDISFNKKIRVGGLVKTGSINKEENTINFIMLILRVKKFTI